MTDNERLANELVDAAYGRMAEGNLEPGDKVIIVLARNNDKVVELVRKVGCAAGKPLTLFDQLKSHAPAAGGSGGLVAVLLVLLDRL